MLGLNFDLYNQDFLIGKKIYLKRIIEWLNYYNQSKFKIINMKKYHNNDSFTLNNKKLLKRINIKISINKLEKECKEISKNLNPIIRIKHISFFILRYLEDVGHR